LTKIASQSLNTLMHNAYCPRPYDSKIAQFFYFFTAFTNQRKKTLDWSPRDHIFYVHTVVLMYSPFMTKFDFVIFLSRIFRIPPIEFNPWIKRLCFFKLQEIEFLLHSDQDLELDSTVYNLTGEYLNLKL